MLYVGVDAHKATSHITVMDDTGKVLRRKRVPSSFTGICETLGCYREPMRAVLEASGSWGPMYDWLDEVVDEVVLTHPKEVRAIADARIKTDKIDSETLAHLLRADLIPTAYAPSKDVRAIKRVLRQRLFFVRVQTMVKTRIWALLSQHAVEFPKVGDLYGQAGLRWLRSLPGIGDFLSVLIRYEVDDITRFREAKKLASYTGLIPSTYASGPRTVKR